MRKFQYLNVIKFTDNPNKIKQMLNLGYKEIIAVEKVTKKEVKKETKKKGK